MSLDVKIKYKHPRRENYFLNHPYIYSRLSEYDRERFSDEEYWTANITHNLGGMASHVPVEFKGEPTDLYMACWRPEEIGAKTVADILPLLIQGIHYMLDHRRELLQYESPNGYGTYPGFMKFLLNYKEACEDSDPDCEIETDR